MIDRWAALSLAEELWASVLAQTPRTALDQRSGGGEWTVRELIDHVGGGALRYTMLLGGASAEDTAVTRGGDYVGDDPLARFRELEHDLRTAAEIADLTVDVDHRAGRRPGSELLTMRTMDLTLHAHDLCAGTDLVWEPPEALAEYLLSEAAGAIEEFRGMGMFAAQVVPSGPMAADRLLGFAGRN